MVAVDSAKIKTPAGIVIIVGLILAIVSITSYTKQAPQITSQPFAAFQCLLYIITIISYMGRHHGPLCDQHGDSYNMISMEFRGGSDRLICSCGLCNVCCVAVLGLLL